MNSAFHYNNPLIAMLAKVGNMMLVSFFWLIACVPVVTVIPATAALYHTTAKVIRGNGNGVARDFFATLRHNFKQGAILSLLCAMFAFLLYTAIDFGLQVSTTGFGFVYLMIGLFLFVPAVGTLVMLPPVLSRFVGSVFTLIRLSAYLSARHPVRALLMLLFLGFVAVACWFYPVLLLMLPGIYMDLVCSGVEKTFAAYMKEAGLQEPGSAQETEEPEALEVPTAMEQAAALEADSDNQRGE